MDSNLSHNTCCSFRQHEPCPESWGPRPTHPWAGRFGVCSKRLGIPVHSRMDRTMAAPSAPVPKKFSKGRTHIPRAPKQHAPDQLLAAEQQAHKETRIKLAAAVARVKNVEKECSNSQEVTQTLQQQLCGLSAELRLKQTDLQLMSSQMAEAHDVAAALDATVTDMSARLLAQERKLQQQRSAAHELAVNKKQAACAVEEQSRLQLAHAATLAELVQYKRSANTCIAFLQQQLQDKGASLSAADACKQAAVNDLAAQQFAFQAATSQIAVLQQLLAVTRDSLAQLQDNYQAAQDDISVQKNATFIAEAKITDLELNLKYITASRSDTQRRCELLSADLAAHKAAANTAECRIATLHVQLQDSSTRCAELEIAHQAAQDDLVRQASAAAAASAAYATRVQELEGMLQDAVAKLQHLQLAKEASLDLLTDITADSLVSQAACQFVMGQRLKAADAAAKAQRDKYAVRDAEARGFKWQLAKSEASNKRLQHEAATSHQQLAAVAETAVQLKVKLQTVAWGQTAAVMQAEELDTATRVVKQQLYVAKQKLADAEDQLFGWACAAAATSLTANSPASSPADIADGVFSSPASTVLLYSSLPSSRSSIQDDSSPSNPIEPGWKQLMQPPVDNLLYQQMPASANLTPVSSYGEVSSLNLLATQTLQLEEAPNTTTSKPSIRVPKLYQSLNKFFKRFGVLCSGGLSKRSSSPQALDEFAVQHDCVINSCLASPYTSTVPARQMSLHGFADPNGAYTNTATQGSYYTAAAEVAAAVTSVESGTTGSSPLAAVPCLSRWGDAAAGTGIAGYSSPRSSAATAGSYSLTGCMDAQSATAESLVVDVAVGGVVDSKVDDDNDLAIDGETVAVRVVEKSTGTKAAPAEAAVTDVRAVVGM